MKPMFAVWPGFFRSVKSPSDTHRAALMADSMDKYEIIWSLLTFCAVICYFFQENDTLKRFFLKEKLSLSIPFALCFLFSDRNYLNEL